MITGYTSVTEDAYLTAHWISKKMWHHFQILTLLCNKRERRSVGRSSMTGQYISVKKSLSVSVMSCLVVSIFFKTLHLIVFDIPQSETERLDFLPSFFQGEKKPWLHFDALHSCETDHLKLNKSKRPTDISHPCVTAIHILFYKIM